MRLEAYSRGKTFKAGSKLPAPIEFPDSFMV